MFSQIFQVPEQHFFSCRYVFVKLFVSDLSLFGEVIDFLQKILHHWRLHNLPLIPGFLLLVILLDLCRNLVYLQVDEYFDRLINF